MALELFGRTVETPFSKTRRPADKHTGAVLNWISIGFAIAISLVILLTYLEVYFSGIHHVNRKYDRAWREIGRQEGIEMERRETLHLLEHSMAPQHSTWELVWLR